MCIFPVDEDENKPHSVPSISDKRNFITQLTFAMARFLGSFKSFKVTVRGPKDDVEKAKKMLAELANEKQLSSMTCEVRAKPEHHKFLIGRHGSNVQAIRDKTGARIIFPGEKDKDREVITIVGTKDAVAAAKTELENKIKGLVRNTEMTSNFSSLYLN